MSEQGRERGRGSRIMMAMALDLETLPKQRLAEFCRRHRIRRLAIFGSALREDFTSRSDVDVLVEFEPRTKVGLSLFTMQHELAGILGRTVDLNTPGFLGERVRQKVLAEAQALYVAA
jgi:predicted nucleotidyltransferase